LISYLIDEQGKILKVYPKVQPADYPEEALRDAG
jgi:peroxiredoxin